MHKKQSPEISHADLYSVREGQLRQRQFPDSWTEKTEERSLSPPVAFRVSFVFGVPVQITFI